MKVTQSMILFTRGFADEKAIIKVNLVPESAEISNRQIEREIRKDAWIPWVSEIEKVTVVEHKK